MAKRVRAWLTTWGNNTAEAQYHLYSALIDTVIPKNGGQMQGNGTWAEWMGGLTSSFAQELKALAHAAGQRYVPAVNSGHGDNWGEFAALMDNPDLWETSADNLVSLALEGRADSPWDGIEFDSVATNWIAYNEKEQAYIQLLSYKVRAAGLPFESTCGGMAINRPKLEHSLFAQTGDRVDCITYGGEWPPLFLNPFWYAEASIQTALKAGICANRLHLGLPLFCKYWPVTGEVETSNLSHAKAMQIVHDANSFVQWIERDDSGLVREKYADVGRGHIWIADGDTLRTRLELVDRYALGGVMLFALDYGDAGFWQTIAEWKRPAPVPRPSKPQDFFSRAPTGAGDVRSYALLN